MAAGFGAPRRVSPVGRGLYGKAAYRGMRSRRPTGRRAGAGAGDERLHLQQRGGAVSRCSAPRRQPRRTGHAAGAPDARRRSDLPGATAGRRDRGHQDEGVPLFHRCRGRAGEGSLHQHQRRLRRGERGGYRGNGARSADRPRQAAPARRAVAPGMGERARGRRGRAQGDRDLCGGPSAGHPA